VNLNYKKIGSKKWINFLLNIYFHSSWIEETLRFLVLLKTFFEVVNDDKVKLRGAVFIVSNNED